VLSPKRKDQISSKKKQSTCRRAVPRSSTIPPNDLGREDAEGKSRKAMKQTKGRIAECSGDPD
ncbi:hypothetical protein MTR67_034982, partial [Solanum verrucosum]